MVVVSAVVKYIGLGHRHAIYINVLKGMLMYIARLCPILSVHFYAIPIYTSNFLNFLFTCEIFNCDETGLPLEHTPPCVVSIKGQKHLRAATSGYKKNITVMACCNVVIPPLIIFRRKALNRALVDGKVAGTMYGLNDRGWMDYEVFDNCFTHHFLRHAPPTRPLLLLLDGHSTHYHPGFITKAACEQVIVFCIPPNTSTAT